jgi:hypothetical protein
MKVKSFKIPEREGFERGAALVIVPTPSGNFNYLCHAWEIGPTSWVLQLTSGNQVEIHKPGSIFLHIPQSGLTFDSDGKSRELKSTSLLVVN